MAEIGESSEAGPPQIAVLTWTQVVCALRTCLRAPEQDLAWKAWAVAFCGAIEQRILQLPSLESLPKFDSVATGLMAAFATYLNLLEVRNG